MSSDPMQAIRADQALYGALYRGEGTHRPMTVAEVTETTTGFGPFKKHTKRSNSARYDVANALPAAISRAMARLVFGEAPKVTGDEDSIERLDAILAAAKWLTQLSKAAETASAHGDVYLKWCWDENVRACVIPAVVHPSKVTPTFTYGILTRVEIVENLGARRGKVYRHIETHTPGRIVHQLWEGTESKRGRLVPLTEHEVTAPLAGLLDMDETSPDAFIETGTSRILVTHVPNAVPNRKHDTHPVGAWLGRSDYEGVIDQFAARSKVQANIVRDVDHGQSRIHVPQSLTKGGGLGDAATIDLDQDLYVVLPGGLGGEKDGALASQMVHTKPDIRIDALSGADRYWLNDILQTVGLGAAALGLTDAGQGTTATEVHARDAATRQTRDERIAIWSDALVDFYTTGLELDAHVFGGSGPGASPIVVEFAPSASPTLTEQAALVTALSASESASIATRVQILHPDWTKEQVDAEVAQIKADNGQAYEVDALGV